MSWAYNYHSSTSASPTSPTKSVPHLCSNYSHINQHSDAQYSCSKNNSHRDSLPSLDQIFIVGLVLMFSCWRGLIIWSKLEGIILNLHLKLKVRLWEYSPRIQGLILIIWSGMDYWEYVLSARIKLFKLHSKTKQSLKCYTRISKNSYKATKTKNNWSKNSATCWSTNNNQTNKKNPKRTKTKTKTKTTNKTCKMKAMMMMMRKWSKK